MLRVTTFLRKSIRKIGLFSLFLLALAAPRAWADDGSTGNFQIMAEELMPADTLEELAGADSVKDYYYDGTNDVLHIKLGKAMTVSGKGKGIVVNRYARPVDGSPTPPLTLKNLTVSPDSTGSVALWVKDSNKGGTEWDGKHITIEIEGTVTLSGDTAGFLVNGDPEKPGKSTTGLFLYAKPEAVFDATAANGNGLGTDAHSEVKFEGGGSFNFVGSGTDKSGIFILHPSILSLEDDVTVTTTGLNGASGLKSYKLDISDNAKLSAEGGDSIEGPGGAGIDVQIFDAGDNGIVSAKGGDGSPGGDGIKTQTFYGSSVPSFKVGAYAEIESAVGGNAIDGSDAKAGSGIRLLENTKFQIDGSIDTLKAGNGTESSAFKLGGSEVTGADITVTPPGLYRFSVTWRGKEASNEELVTDLQGKGIVWFPLQTGAEVTVSHYWDLKREAARTVTLPLTEPIQLSPAAYPVSFDIVFKETIEKDRRDVYYYIVRTNNLLPAPYTVKLIGAEGVEVENQDERITIEADNSPASITLSDEDLLASTLASLGRGRGELVLSASKQASQKFYNEDSTFLFGMWLYDEKDKSYFSDVLKTPLSLKGTLPQENNGDNNGDNLPTIPLPSIPDPSTEIELWVDTEDGPRHAVEQESLDGAIHYLIMLPPGADLGAVKIEKSPRNRRIEPSLDEPLDFLTENPRKFTVTAEDGTTEKTIWIKVAAPSVAPGKLVLDPSEGDWLLYTRQEEDGAYSVALAAPFAPEAPQEPPTGLYISSSIGLSNVGLSVAWVEVYDEESGTVSPVKRMLWIGGTAKDREALTKSLKIEEVSFVYGTQPGVTQTFDPPVTFGSIKEKNRWVMKPIKSSKSGSGGCDTGNGGAAVFAVFAAGCAAFRKRRVFSLSIVERSFGWLDKCRRMWKNCDRLMNVSLKHR